MGLTGDAKYRCPARLTELYPLPRLAPSTISILFLLSACAGPSPDTVHWQRDNTSEDEARADLHDCAHAAQAQVDREQASQGLAGDQMGQSSLAASIDAYDQQKRVDQLTRRCMALRGYQAGSEPAS